MISDLSSGVFGLFGTLISAFTGVFGDILDTVTELSSNIF